MIRSPHNPPGAPPVPWPDDFDLGAVSIDGHPGRGRRLRWLVIPIAVVLVGAGALYVANPFKSVAASLVTAQATVGTIVSSVSISGTVASSTVDELSFAAAGAVTAINVTPGQKVTAGQVLATIDDTALADQIASAEATLAAATARLATDRTGATAAARASARDSITQAQLQLSSARQSLSDTYAQDNQSLAQARAAVSAAKATLATDKVSLPAGDPQIARDKAGVTSATAALSAAKVKATATVDQARAQVRSASLGVTTAKHGYTLKVAPAPTAQIASDRASVAQATQALATLPTTGSAITASDAGTVTAVNLVVGQQVTGPSTGSGAGATATTTTGQIEVMDLANLRIAGQASEADIANLKMNQPATITATGLGTATVVGTVCSLGIVGTQISGVASFPVTVCLDAANSSLLVGMSATAAVQTQRADNAVLVPSLAVRTVGGQQVVTVVNPNGTQSTVQVTTGITNGSQTQVLSGLDAGATVVETLQTTTTNRGAGGGGRGPFPGGGGFGGG